jgi:predicted aldo/keto reductase-like oxidoreductase
VENIGFFAKDDPTTDEENKLLRKVVDTFADIVPCTNCAYCVEACPKNLDIPKLISMGNELRFSKNAMVTKMFTISAMTEAELPSACIACGKCNALCPQEINIPPALKQFAENLA